MSCNWCVHFLPENNDPRNDAVKGHCTLNPVWVETVGGHYCGQIQYGADKYGPGRTTLVNRWSKDWRQLRNEQDKLQADQKKLATEKRLVAAEKRLQKLADANSKKDTP